MEPEKRVLANDQGRALYLFKQHAKKHHHHSIENSAQTLKMKTLEKLRAQIKAKVDSQVFIPGIHAQNLPQIQAEQDIEQKKYWQKSNSYIALPKNVSQLKLKTSTKWWAKEERLLLQDVQTEPCSQRDVFKQVHIKLEKNKDITEKITKTHFIKKDSQSKHQKTAIRYTEEILKFSMVKERLFDNLPKALHLKHDHDPMYSSFSKDKVFKAPMTAKQAIQRKKIKDYQTVQERHSQEETATGRDK